MNTHPQQGSNFGARNMAAVHQMTDTADATPVKSNLNIASMRKATASYVARMLQRAKTDWIAEPVKDESPDANMGISLRLVNIKLGASIPVGFSSVSSRCYAVRLFEDWFNEERDGTVTFDAKYETRLMQAFLPAMSNFREWNRLA